jgi:hypothetical protein
MIDRKRSSLAILNMKSGYPQILQIFPSICAICVICGRIKSIKRIAGGRFYKYLADEINAIPAFFWA